MPATPRNQIFDANEVGVYHCFSRCVRRAFLCGRDSYSGKNYEHRKTWVLEGLQGLALSMAVDILDYAILLDDHLHVVIRNRPDIVQGWSDQEVARRWWQLCPERRNDDGTPAEPHPCELHQWLHDAEQITELRSRLSHISWFMRLLCQPIAVRANREDGVTGSFFEGRFHSDRLLDESAVLACSMYVDLNVIRAGKADTPEQSEHTSVYDRIRGRWLRTQRLVAGAGAVCNPTDPDAWLAPIELDEVGDHCGTGPLHREVALTGDGSRTVRLGEVPAETSSSSAIVSEASEPGHQRALEAIGNPFGSPRVSNKGFLPMTADEYLRLLDCTGRQLHPDKRGAIPADLVPILERLLINPSHWLETVTELDKKFRTAVGRPESMRQRAARMGRRWLQGIRQCARAFT